jgi:hypothetical protein
VTVAADPAVLLAPSQPCLSGSKSRCILTATSRGWRRILHREGPPVESTSRSILQHLCAALTSSDLESVRARTGCVSLSLRCRTPHYERHHVVATDPIEQALKRRLPGALDAERAALTVAYRSGVSAHAEDRTIGTGPVPTNLSTERVELLAFVCRKMGRLLSEEEVAALLRIPVTAARSLRKQMLAVHDDLPDLGLRTAFTGAKRDGRGTEGDVVNGYRVKITSAEKLELATSELERRGFT